MMDRPAAALAHRFLSVVAGRRERFDEAHEHLRRAGELSRAPSATSSPPGELWQDAYGTLAGIGHPQAAYAASRLGAAAV